jgi:hypothetical protein
MAMMAITTSNSIRVKAFRLEENDMARSSFQQ